MTTRRLTVLSLGRARAAWPRELARWATAGLLSVDHQPCLGPEELERRLDTGAPPDVVVLDGGLAEIGRRCVRQARERGCAVLVIDDEPRGWVELGAGAVAPPPDDPESVRRLLEQLAPTAAPPRPVEPAARRRGAGWLVAVTGHGGSGASTVAHGLAHRWAEVHPDRQVLLADLSLQADLHVHHDRTEVGAGLVDLVAGHQRSPMSAERLVACTSETTGRHRLLTGVRRPRDWTALAPPALEAALDGLQDAFDIVVADVDRDLDGRAETGSADVEERNGLARSAVRRAGAVVLVARDDLLGVHRLCRQLESLLATGVEPRHLHVVANWSRGDPTAASVLKKDLLGLLGPSARPLSITSIPRLAGLEARRRDGRAPGRRLGRRLAPLDDLAGPTPGRERDGSVRRVPERVVPR